MAAFDATVVGSTPGLPVACGEAVLLENPSVGELVEIELRAFETGAATPRWATRCFATAISGVQVRASCDPLAEITAPPAPTSDAGPDAAADAS